MLIYLLVIVLILLLKNNLLNIPAGQLRDKTEEKYLRIICWILVLLAALRGSSVGTDTITYLSDYYYRIPSFSFSDIINDHFKDAFGLAVLAKICIMLHLPAQIFFGIVEGLYVLAFYAFTKQYSTDKLISVLFFFTIGLYSISLAALKQTMSMAFTLFFFLSLKDKKYIRTVLFAYIAYICHPASSIFLFGVALYIIRNSKLFYYFLFAIVIVCAFGTSLLWSTMINILENEHYATYLSDDIYYSNVSLIFYGVLLSFLFLFSKDYRKKKKEESRIMMGIACLAFAVQFIASISSTAFRLSYFFLPFMTVALPNCFNCMGNIELRRLVKTIVAFMIVFFYIYTNRNGGSIVPYRFFWQV